LLNSLHDLKTTPYQFTAEAGNHNQRFRIVYLNTSLGNPDFENQNEIKVITNESLSVISSKQLMKSVVIYNVLGQELDRYQNVNSHSVILSNQRKNNTTLLLKIELETGLIITRKVIY
jgi:hypothetical protein